MDKVKAKIIELVPEITELKPGCEIIWQRPKDGFRRYFLGYDPTMKREGKPAIFWQKYSVIITLKEEGGSYNCTVKTTDLTALGRPIQLADVLRAIEATAGDGQLYFVTDGGAFGEDGDGLLGHSWNLAADYDGQSQETKDFIGKLIGVE